MATRSTSTPAPNRGERRPVWAFLATMATIAGVPVAISAYAQSRPISEAVCQTGREHLGLDLIPVDVTTCRIAGVEVSRSVRLAPGQEG